MTSIRVSMFLLFCTLHVWCAGCTDRGGLTSAEILRLTNGQAKGPVAVSPDGGTLAFSDGKNIFTLQLISPDVGPVQLTNTTSAFTPNFLLDGTLVFGSINSTRPDQINLFSVPAGTVNGSPAVVDFGTITAADLGLAAGTPLNAPDQFLVNPTGIFGTATINGQPFLFNFASTPVSTTPLNNSFGQQIFNPVLSPDLSQFAFTNSAGQVGLTTFSNGFLDTAGTSFIGAGTFPSFTPSGQATFFGNNAFNTFNTNGSISSVGLGSPAITPSMPVFAPNGQVFFTTNGGSIAQSTFPAPGFGLLGSFGTGLL